MSFGSVVTAVAEDVRKFYSVLAADIKKAKQVWLIISSAQTRSVLLAVGADAIKIVKDTGEAAAGKGLSLTLDEAVLADVQQLIKDAEAGDAVIAADLKALGISL